MDLQLNDKTALVTGSTGGIGFAIAQALLGEGARVIVNGRSQETVGAAVEKLSGAGGEAIGFAGDLSKADVAEELAEKYPDVDILVNNLGIFEAVSFEDITDDDWERFFRTNVLSGVRLSRLYLPRMEKENWGRIIFISSESAIQIPKEMIHYGMTKSAQISVARGLAEHLAGTGITVNSVLPGPTKTPGVVDFVTDLAKREDKTFEEYEPEFIASERPSSLIQRLAEPDEVASMVAYLSSPLASATNGAAVRVDGGVVKSAF